MKKSLLAVLYFFVSENILSQSWQPMGIPEGSGITDLVYWSGGGAVYGDKLWATTGSVDWPTGQRGGVFYSATTPPYQGTWYRIGGSAGHYIGRTLAVGQDGNLYASLWRNPTTFQADGLFKFLPQVGDFGLIYQAEAGDNIFSIAVKNNPHTIFAGTRNGVICSTDNGTTFGYSNTGIPDSAWVYDIAIDSVGIVAIASSKGVFITTDNGDNWLTTAGIASEDTVVSLLFVSDVPELAQENKNSFTNQTDDALFGGTSNGKIYRGWGNDFYVQLVLLYVLTPDNEEFKFMNGLIESLFGFSRSRSSAGNILTENNNTSGVYKSADYGTTWIQINNGLPANPPVSALAFKLINETSAQLYAGLFNDTTNGAGVYKLDVTVDVEENGNEIPSEYLLEQNYPNPFNPTTTIQFSIPEQSFVKLEVFNALGKKVSTLVSEELNAGNYKYEWNAENLPSGIYFYRLKTNNFEQSKKLVLLK